MKILCRRIIRIQPRRPVRSSNLLRLCCGSLLRGRGLTLIELLLVIALLLAMSALVAPPMVRALRDRALEAAADTAAEQLMLARAHAQNSGKAVEVLVRDHPPRIVARYFKAGSEAIGEGDRRAAAMRGEDDPFAAAARNGDEANDTNEDDVLPANWAHRALPAGIRLEARPPERIRERSAFGEPSEDGGRERAGPVRLAVFMPDGSALFGTPVWLTAENERAVKLEVNLWTGLPSVEAHRDEPGESRETASEGGRVR